MGAATWRVERLEGSARDIHARPLPDVLEPTVWVVTPTDRSVVLGSTQRHEDVDAAAAERRGLAIARRRSGGGAVLVTPGALVWVDVILPRTHPAWVDDIGRSSVWMGERWAAALSSLGIEVDLVQPPMPADDLARVVCFVGRGPGEILIEGAKVVGISQRRTRDAARFQCAALLSWEPEPLIDVLRVRSTVDADRVRAAGRGLPVAADRLVDALIAALD
ncbi:MAG: hypothetical protein AAF480_06105 [Actinomycetota bacterium]